MLTCDSHIIPQSVDYFGESGHVTRRIGPQALEDKGVTSPPSSPPPLYSSPSSPQILPISPSLPPQPSRDASPSPKISRRSLLLPPTPTSMPLRSFPNLNTNIQASKISQLSSLNLTPTETQLLLWVIIPLIFWTYIRPLTLPTKNPSLSYCDLTLIVTRFQSCMRHLC